MSPDIISEYAFGISEVILSCFFAINGYILWFCCVQYLSLNHGSDMSSFIRLRNIALSFIGLCSIACFCIGIANILVAADEIKNYDTAIIFWAFSVVIFSVCFTIHPYFFITRLLHTFKGTSYKITHTTTTILVILTTVLLTLFLFTGALMVMDTLKYFPVDLGPRIDNILENVKFTLWIILGIQQFCIANLFSSKLLAITLQISTLELTPKSGATAEIEPPSISISLSKAINKKQDELLTLIAKQTFLSRIDSIVVIIFVLLKILVAVINNNQVIINVSDAFNYAYLICISITMQLSFVFADKSYHCCCSKCHQCYLNKYEKEATKNYKIKKRQQKQTQESATPIIMTNDHESDHYNYVLLNDD